VTPFKEKPLAADWVVGWGGCGGYSPTTLDQKERRQGRRRIFPFPTKRGERSHKGGGSPVRLINLGEEKEGQMRREKDRREGHLLDKDDGGGLRKVLLRIGR